MNKEQKDNSGAAFRRNNKNPKAPQYSGPVMVNGEELEISIWERTTKKGLEYLSVKFGPPWKKDGQDEVSEF